MLDEHTVHPLVTLAGAGGCWTFPVVNPPLVEVNKSPPTPPNTRFDPLAAVAIVDGRRGRVVVTVVQLYPPPPNGALAAP